MKKKIFYRIIILAVIMLAVFSAVISSCNFKFGDSTLLTEPSIDYADSSLTISIPVQSKSTKWVNIYREDVTDIDEKKWDDDSVIEKHTMSIGLIFPENLESGGSSYIFQDPLIIQGQKYRYKVRYYISGKYYPSNWSNAVTVSNENAFDSSLTDDDLTYQANGATFTYDEEDYTITLSAAVTAPDSTVFADFATDYSPAIIIKKELEDGEDYALTKAFNIKDSVLDGTASLNLKSLLSNTDFMDKKITVEGIVGQKKELVSTDSESTEEKIMRIIWSKPLYIKITGKSNNQLTIPTGASTDGFDFSRSILSENDN